MLRIKRLATLLLLTLVLTTAAWAKQKEVNIVATNDMHANIDAFPQLGAIVDSLRAINPSLLVF
jgi:5'-nucleotidase/2',3'-cyclic-nucleotide 2'-phosphodiesterase/3'-nucleotidase/5'-nucleotidase